jgi:hypothetical protein
MVVIKLKKPPAVTEFDLWFPRLPGTAGAWPGAQLFAGIRDQLEDQHHCW